MPPTKQRELDYVGEIILSSLDREFYLLYRYTGGRKSLRNKIINLEPRLARGRKKGYISYNQISNSGKKRCILLTNRFLVRKLELTSPPFEFKNVELGKLANKIDEQLFQNICIKIVKGTEITKAYENHVGNSSCMTGNCCEFTLLYEMNPDRIQMIIATQRSNSARAILWKLDNGNFFVDRIYCNVEFLAEEIDKFAKKNHWLSRCHNLTACGDELFVSNLEFEDGHIPYMDTFRTGKIIHKHGNHPLLNLSYNGEGEYYLNSTDGCFGGRSMCSCCGENFHEDDLISYRDEIWCNSCFEEHFTNCQRCGRAIHNDLICTHINQNKQELSVCNRCYKILEEEKRVREEEKKEMGD